MMPTPTFPEPPPSDDVLDEAAAPPKERPPVEQTLVALGTPPVAPETVAHLSDLSRAEAAVLRRAWPHYPEATRVEIVRLMETLPEERLDVDFGRALRVALADESAVVRQLAVAALWEGDGTGLADDLVRMLRGDPSQDVRAEAAAALGRFVERHAEHGVIAATEDSLCVALLAAAGDAAEGYGVRRRALESLGAVAADPTVRAVVDAFLGEDDQGYRASAIYAIGRSGSRTWLSTLLADLVCDDAELRFESARALGTIGDADAIVPLVRAAADEDPEVRLAAIASLGQIGGRAAVRALDEIAIRGDGSDDEAIEEARAEATAMLDPLRYDA